MAKWRGTPIDRVEIDPASMTYVLYDDAGVVLAEIPEHVYLSNPALKRMSIHGRYRRAAAKTQGHPAQAPGPGNAGSRSLPPTPALTLAAIRALQARLTRGPIFPFALDPDGSAKPVEDAGIRAGEIVAHRAWMVDHEGLLRSVYMEDYVWFPGASARGDPVHEAGVHAFKSAERTLCYVIDKQLWQTRNWGEGARRAQFVIGTVELWGEVIEHEHGYRAEYAAIRSLDMGVEITNLGPLRARYCTTYDMPEAFRRAHRGLLERQLLAFAERNGPPTLNFIPWEPLDLGVSDGLIEPAPANYVTVIFVRDAATGSFLVAPDRVSRRLIADWCERNAQTQD